MNKVSSSTLSLASPRPMTLRLISQFARVCSATALPFAAQGLILN